MLSQGGQFISETSQPVCSDRKNLSSEIGFHGKISCCLQDNDYYDYTDHSKAKNQDTDLLTGFLLIREEKKKPLTGGTLEEKARLPFMSLTWGNKST